MCEKGDYTDEQLVNDLIALKEFLAQYAQPEGIMDGRDDRDTRLGERGQSNLDRAENELAEIPENLVIRNEVKRLRLLFR